MRDGRGAVAQRGGDGDKCASEVHFAEQPEAVKVVHSTPLGRSGA